MKRVFESYTEALETCKTGFSNGYPLWIYENKEGFQISNMCYANDKAPDYIMSLEEYHSTRTAETAYCDPNIPKMDVIKIGINRATQISQFFKPVDFDDVIRRFKGENTLLMLDFQATGTERDQHFGEFMRFVFKCFTKMRIEWARTTNHSYLLHKGTDKDQVHKEIMNSALLYHALSSGTVAI